MLARMLHFMLTSLGRQQVTDGSIEFAVNKVDGATGEFSGVFVSEQLSDTDMGSKAPKKVRQNSC